MYPGKVTDLAIYRATRAAPLAPFIRLHQQAEQITLTNIRILAAMQRDWMRLWQN